jgi:uncharacterized protein (TIGR03663 family)
VIGVAALARFAWLSSKPLHHDEGVNAYFMLRLLGNGYYRYDPANYHGPSLYFFASLTSGFSAFFLRTGLSTFGLRAAPALFGTATVCLLLLFRRQLGNTGAIAAAALTAVSPGAIYLSRYFIHESLLVFFTVAVVAAVLQFALSGRSKYLVCASAAAALMLATKETALISLAVLLVAASVASVYVRYRTTGKLFCSGGMRRLRDELSGLLPVLLLVFGVAAGILLLFYSSFFTNFPQGIYDFGRSLRIWSKTAGIDNRHVWWMYLSWMARAELPLAILGVAGIVTALWHGRSRFGVFAALWALGTLAAYSLIPYKTPWLMLNFTVPLACVAGYGIENLFQAAANGAGVSPLRWLPGAVAACAVIFSAYDATVFNFFQYDDPARPYVYAHTQRDFLRLIDRVDAIAKRSGAPEKTSICITSREYWPLPWYLRSYRYAGYPGTTLAKYNEAMVIGSAVQESELSQSLGDRYRLVDRYPLRPGVMLSLFVRRDLTIASR